MTQEIYGEVWQDEVVSLALENPDIDLGADGSETLIVRAVFGGNMASQRKDNSNFTFVVETTPTPATGVTVGEHTGVVTATSATDGTALVSVTLTDYPNVPPAYALVTIKVG